MRETRLFKRFVVLAGTIGLPFILCGLFFMLSAARCRGQAGPVRIQISPANPSIAASGNQAFTASAPGFFRGAQQTGKAISVTWSSSNASVATINTQSGMATTTGQGTTSITARHGAFAGSTTLLVGVSTITVSPASQAIPFAGTQQFKATATFGAGGPQDVTRAVAWSSSNTAVATISNAPGSQGLATSRGQGTTTITAAIAGAAPSTASLTVNPPQFPAPPSNLTALAVTSSEIILSWINNANNQTGFKVERKIGSAGTYIQIGTTSANGTGFIDSGLSATTQYYYRVRATNTSGDSPYSNESNATTPGAITGAHPRIILDAATLTGLRARAQANTPEWIALKSVCDSYNGGSVNFPDQNGYPNLPNIGEGYQGSDYYYALLSVGLCYQVARTFDPTNAALYGAKGVDVLMKMSDPAHQLVGGSPIQNRDSGYGIRFYGGALGIGYDWFHDLMNASQQAQVYNDLNLWISDFENNSFEYEHPQSNYFAGYYDAKGMAAIATQDDNPNGNALWNDWYTNQHGTRVAPYYNLSMIGGGWPEGFANYGPLGTMNQGLPTLAARTAKGLDLIHDTNNPYTFPLDAGDYLMHFTWPSRDFIDDRGTTHTRGDSLWPGTAEPNLYSFLAGFLGMWNSPHAAMMHKYARDVKTVIASQTGQADPWIEFLFWDNNAPEQDYTTLPRSYLAPGISIASARSDWSTGAVWMSFTSGPYVNAPGQGEQSYDSGSLALVKGKNPLLVNVSGWITHQPNGDPGESAIYDDNYGNWDADHTQGNRKLNNTFQVRHLDNSGNVLEHYGQYSLGRADGVKTNISRFEDGNSYVLAVGEYLEDTYRPFVCGPPISSWSRQIVYLRPNQFVVYDRTTICNAAYDQYLAFHFPANAVAATPPAAGERRYDVTFGTFSGSVTTVLPANSATTVTDHVAPDPMTWNKIWRLEVRPPGPANANQRWLTVFDLSDSAAQVANATPVNVTSGSVLGALLASPVGAGNSVVLAGSAAFGQNATGTLVYVVPAAQTHHVITDLPPNTTYNVSVNVASNQHTVTVAPAGGGTFTTSANGALSFNVNIGGAVTP
jgi:hypothetical protein